jgi:hypothetical protein
LSPARLLAIGFIYACAAVAWFTLGASVVKRTGQSDHELTQEVTRLWGGRHHQVAPVASFERSRTVVEETSEKDDKGHVSVRRTTRTVTDTVPLPLTATRVDVVLDLDHRRKGLLWYDTYAVGFAGHYRVRNTDAEPHTVTVHFTFPAA